MRRRGSVNEIWAEEFGFEQVGICTIRFVCNGDIKTSINRPKVILPLNLNVDSPLSPSPSAIIALFLLLSISALLAFIEAAIPSP